MKIFYLIRTSRLGSVGGIRIKSLTARTAMAPIRTKIVANFTKTLAGDAADVDGSDPGAIATALEAALWKHFGMACNSEYKAKYRSINFNLKKNDDLRKDMLVGMFTPAEIVGWSPDMVRTISTPRTAHNKPSCAHTSPPRAPCSHGTAHTHTACALRRGPPIPPPVQLFCCLAVLAPTRNQAFLSSGLVAVNDQKAYQS